MKTQQELLKMLGELDVRGKVILLIFIRTIHLLGRRKKYNIVERRHTFA